MTIEKSTRKIGFGSSTVCKKVNTADTDENLFRLPLELVPVPGHAAQISARAPTKGYVQTVARARAPCQGTKSERGHSL